MGGCGMGDAGCGMRDAGWEMGDGRLEMGDGRWMVGWNGDREGEGEGEGGKHVKCGQNNRIEMPDGIFIGDERDGGARKKMEKEEKTRG